MSEHQAEADTIDESTAADQLAGAEDSQKGTNELAAYEAELAAAMSAAPEDETQGDDLADVDQDEDAPELEEESAEEQSEEQSEEVADEVEPEPEDKSKRYRFNDPTDQAVAAIAKAKGVSLVEAARIFEGVSPTKPQDPAREDSQEAVDTVDSVQARLEELEELEAQSSSALEFETANEHRKEANKLRNKLMDLKIAEVQEKSRSEADAERKFYADYAENEAEALKYYPDAAKAETALAKEISRLDAEMRELGDPLYHSDKKPFALAKQAAKNLGIPMTNPNRSVTKKPAVQNRPIQPAGGNARTTAPTSTISKIDQAVANVGTEYDYDKLVGSLLKTRG